MKPVLASLVCIAIGGSLAGASSAANPAPQKVVTASAITRRLHTLAPGSAVSSAALAQRVFINANFGFALATKGGAQYPAATTDSGKTWKTDGPALHVAAAQAPLSITNIGVASRRTIFAFGGGQVVDTTSDGGKHWYSALFNGLVMAAVRGPTGHLVAFVDASPSTSGIWQYVSKDGGRTWTYSTTVGG